MRQISVDDGSYYRGKQVKKEMRDEKSVIDMAQLGLTVLELARMTDWERNRGGLEECFIVVIADCLFNLWFAIFSGQTSLYFLNPYFTIQGLSERLCITSKAFCG